MDCRGCGRPITFVTLSTGRKHPVDGEPDGPEAFYLHQREPLDRTRPRTRLKIICPDGQIVSGWEGDRYESGTLRVEGWPSHFGTCPQADAFRRPPAERRPRRV